MCVTETLINKNDDSRDVIPHWRISELAASMVLMDFCINIIKLMMTMMMMKLPFVCV